MNEDGIPGISKETLAMVKVYAPKMGMFSPLTKNRSTESIRTSMVRKSVMPRKLKKSRIMEAVG